MDPILDDLNEAQRRAVLHGEGPLLVLAGAGSGKTRVVTRRIARLLRDGVPSGAVLALTFTNKAAGEMARRVAELGGDWVRISTFHSACARFLRVHADRLGYPQDYSICDTQDRDALIRTLMDEQGIGAGRVKPHQVGRMISRLKNLDIAPDDHVAGVSELHVVTERLYPLYEERMRRQGCMDFDDLLLRFVELLRGFPDLQEEYRRRFPWVLVDEFQDTNRVQYDLLQLLCPPAGNVCVVGDPDQSIYAFRGAEVRNLLDFPQDFPDTEVIRLETNYRSTEAILHAAEEVIRHNSERFDKRLRTEQEGGEPVVVHVAEEPELEAREVATRIAGRLGEGTSPGEIAVFYRSHFLSRVIEEAFRKYGVPYTVVGGVSFFERREIKDLLAYLRVVANPLDDISMGRIINVPPRGVGKVTLGKLRTHAAAEEMSLVEAVLEPEVRGRIGGKAGKALAELAGVIEDVRAVAGRSVAEALQAVCDGTDYLDHACNLGDPEDVTREENIRELMGDVANFDQDVGGGLSPYLQHVSLLTSADRAESGPAVCLMTVHSAKGLEFDHVYVAGLEEGVFPSSRSVDDPRALEEERRLMYVALTRARKSVWLGRCRRRMMMGSWQDQRRSRFLDELPEETGGEDSWSSWDVVGEGTQDGGFEGWPEQDTGLAVGVRVVHPVYGQGRVLDLTGRGISSKARVRFADESERELLLEYAGLRVVPGEEAW